LFDRDYAWHLVASLADRIAGDDVLRSLDQN
jgi:hypothetical protein